MPKELDRCAALASTCSSVPHRLGARPRAVGFKMKQAWSRQKGSAREDPAGRSKLAAVLRQAVLSVASPG